MPAGTPVYSLTITDIQNQPANITVKSIIVELIAYPIEPDNGKVIYDSDIFVKLTLTYDQLVDASGQNQSLYVVLKGFGAEGTSTQAINTTTKNLVFQYGTNMVSTWTSNKVVYEDGVYNRMAPILINNQGGKPGISIHFSNGVTEELLADSGNASYTMLGQWIHNLTPSTPGDLSIPAQVLEDPWDNPVRMSIQPVYSETYPLGEQFILHFAFKITNNTGISISITAINLDIVLDGTSYPNNPLLFGSPFSLAAGETSGILLMSSSVLQSPAGANWTLNEITAINIDYV